MSRRLLLTFLLNLCILLEDITRDSSREGKPTLNPLPRMQQTFSSKSLVVRESETFLFSKTLITSTLTIWSNN